MITLSYEAFKRTRMKYPSGTRCFMGGCYQEGRYEGGDARYRCPMCEKHAYIDYEYELYLENLKGETKWL